MSATEPPFAAWGLPEIWRAWGLPGTLPALAPQSLVQPILPGWTVNVNSRNSSSPATEADVVARHSYGRQIGRIADALQALLAERAGRPFDAACLERFEALWHDIERVKAESAARRVEQLRTDLEALRQADRAAWERAREALRALLASDAGPASGPG